MLKQPTVKTRTNEFLVTIVNNIEGNQTMIKLNPRVEKIIRTD